MGVMKTIRRAILRESDLEYEAQFAGDDAYWEEALAAQLRCSGEDAAVVLLPAREAAAHPTPDDRVEVSSQDSFPASDAPAWTGMTGLGPPR
jgi:hypothetical protein